MSRISEIGCYWLFDDGEGGYLSLGAFEIGQILHLVINVVEKHTWVQLVLDNWLIRQLVALVAQPEHDLLGLRAKSHFHHISLRKLEGLSRDSFTLMLLFWSARR